MVKFRKADIVIIFILNFIVFQGCKTSDALKPSKMEGYSSDSKSNMERGIVRYANKDCDYLLITFSKGKFYAVCKDPLHQLNAGDIVTGDFGIQGNQKVYNETKKTESQIDIENVFTEREPAFRIIEEKCEDKLPSFLFGFTVN